MRINRVWWVTAISALALAAGCASNGVGGEPSPIAPTWSQYAGATSAPAVPAAAPRANLNARGNVEKKLGETGTIFDLGNGAKRVEFAITGMRAHQGCSNRFMQPPDGFKPLSVDVVVNTYDDPKQELSSIMFGQSWEYIAPDGTSIDATVGTGPSCEYDSPDLKPNRKYTETIWLIIPADAATGHLVWNPLFSGPGFEWALTA